MRQSMPAHLATITRGEAPEGLVRGSIAVVDAGGALVAAAGDPGSVTTVRSCVKPIQALPFVRRAMDVLGASDEELAVACASHSGEPRHVQVVTELLSRCGLDETALSCGPQLPFDDEAARHLVTSGQGPRRLTNNCSGKHAAMLAVCTVAGWPRVGYAAWDHPLQVEIRGDLARCTASDIDAAPRGIDGCGLPTHGLPLHALARAFATAGADPGFQRCQAAMAAHPHLVGGRQQFDTDVLATAGEQLTCKVGGAAVWVAVRRPGGPAVAIKLEAGDGTAMPAVATAVLRTLGWIDDAVLALPAISRHAEPRLRNWDGEVVGGIDVEDGWRHALTG